jgi:hypothetical protein
MSEVENMIFEKGYTFTKVNTSHGQDLYVSRFGQVIKVVPCTQEINLSDAYINNLINQIESIV